MPPAPYDNEHVSAAARPRPANHKNPWEKLISDGQTKPQGTHLHWKATSLLETADGVVGCITADNSDQPLPARVPYQRSELVCLLALLCRELCRRPPSTQVYSTVITFTNTTARVAQARIDVPKHANVRAPPIIYVSTHLEVPLRRTTVKGASGAAAAYTSWLAIVSWLTFTGPSPALEVSKHRSGHTAGHRSLASTTSERLFSDHSLDVTEDEDTNEGDADSDLSRESNIVDLRPVE
ncbi:hypothetical protein ColLi_10919 [Colletotrichum liriopes]|uniref:Uncharacterized protein n=1 Tax=Colletotrichum liriopes TaxID=708192 RepID=A0AA37GVJ3_9PEZI|nr:hypothetical protein ColLi_10919 [Colletotrichum liriopes]